MLFNSVEASNSLSTLLIFGKKLKTDKPYVIKIS